MIMMIFLIAFLIFTILLMFIITSAFLGFVMTRVPFVPTHAVDIPELVKRLGISENDVIYELGSGNGKAVFLFEKHSLAKIKGFEITLWTHLWAKFKGWLTGSKAEFIYKDFFKQPFEDATIIYMYLYPPLMPSLAEKIFLECKPGTRIVSRDFYNRYLNQVDHYQTASGHEMFIYQV